MKYDSLIAANDLKLNLDNPNWVVIDCHFILEDPAAGLKAYQEEHIPGALYAHLDHDLSGKVIPGKTGRHPLPEAQILSETFSNWGINDRVQVVAYDNAGGKIAARLWSLLKWLGHDRVAVLNGGLRAWKDAGYPTEKKINSNSRRKFVPSPRPEMIIDLSKFKGNLPGDMVIIDSRSPERYGGLKEPIDPVAGRIPGALNRFYQNNLTEDEGFKQPQKLEEKFSEYINRSPDGVVFYCGSGVTAAHNILAMYAAGMGLAKLYPGSWSAWINAPDNPIEIDQEKPNRISEK